MQIEILTIFPEYFRTPLRESLLGKSVAAGLLEVAVADLRSFSLDRHRKVDDEPFGGGVGMVMTAPVVAAAIEARRDAEGLPRAWTVLMGPEGRFLHVRSLNFRAAPQGQAVDARRGASSRLFAAPSLQAGQ